MDGPDLVARAGARARDNACRIVVRSKISARLLGMQTFLNLTPHPIVLVGAALTVPPSGVVARCTQVSVPAGEHLGVPLSCVTFGAVEGLPEPAPGVLLIVSALVRNALPARLDLASPGELLRDESGNVTGCKALIVNGVRGAS